MASLLGVFATVFLWLVRLLQRFLEAPWAYLDQLTGVPDPLPIELLPRECSGVILPPKKEVSSNEAVTEEEKESPDPPLIEQLRPVPAVRHVRPVPRALHRAHHGASGGGV